MKEYLLLIWLAGTSPNEAGVQSTMVTRQQCHAVVEVYRELESPIRASCFPPHAKYSTGGVAPVIHSFGPQPSLDDEGLPQKPPLRTSAPDGDRKAP